MKKTLWNYDTCKQEALKYTKRNDFRINSPSAYLCSLKNKWIDEWFSKKIKPFNYWTTYENVLNAAKKCNYYTEFRDTYITAYRNSKKNNWISDFKWLINDIEKFDLNAKVHLIYVYEFVDLKYFYVGRTINLTTRDYNHHFKYKTKNGEKKYDSLNIFCKNNNIDIPKPIILETKLTAHESQEKEDFWIKYYIECGWKKINKAKTGINIGSLGGGRIKWTYDKCYEEAKKYKSRGEYFDGSVQAYRVSLKYGWINDYTWFISKIKAPNYWTYDMCYNEAKKYKLKEEFKKKSHGAYIKSYKEKWIKDFDWFISGHIKEPKWTYEKCKEITINIDSKYDFSKKFNYAYRVCLKNKWIDDFFDK